MFVLDPVECKSCQTAYCNACIQENQYYSKICPKKCEGPNTEIKLGKVHRII